MALVMRAVNDDTKIFDVITLVGGRLRFETGAARPMFDNTKKARNRLQGKHTTDAQLYAALNGWSNGYIKIQERG